jgi:glucose/arabinose dehydrogenase
MRSRQRLVVLAATALALAGCGGEPASEPTPSASPSPDADAAPEQDDAAPGEDDAAPGEDATEPADGEADGPTEPDEVELAATDVATGLEAPWDVAFLGEATFVTERDTGRVLELTADGQVTEVRTFPVDAAGEGGLLGLVAAPDGDALYAYYTSSEDNRVVRFSPDEDGEATAILTGIPSNSTHNGGRLVFGPDGMLYVGTGDAQDQAAAQDATSLAGKVLRITPDGDVPADNPFDNEVFSLGHRNVQGLAFDADGRLLATEFGPDRDDEINLIESGSNYGWPEVTGDAGTQDFTDPLLVRQPAEASWTGASVLTDGAIPQWEGDLLVASLRGERLYRIPIDDGQLGEPEQRYVDEYGRLRHAVQAPDGSLWLLTNNRDGRGDPSEGDDRIVRIGAD